MTYIIWGIIGFLLFFLYDWNSLTGRFRVMRLSFMAGCVLLIGAAAGLVVEAVGTVRFGVIRGCVFLSGAAVFFVLLIYALFFALPFKKTYVEQNGKPSVCRRGVYALCRHPGVLMFTGFFLCLCAALPGRNLIAGSVIFCGLNLAYVIFQDQVSFPKSFRDYDDYKKSTPFLIPTGKSMKECIRTLKDRR